MSREIKVIYEDSDFLALNKPAGVLVHPTSKKETGTLVDWLRRGWPEVNRVGDDPKTRPGIVHRLDKDTSGVLIVAKNQNFFNYLKNLFKKHEVKKTYLALVWGELNGRGIINKPIGLRPGTIKRSANAKKIKMVKEAITQYKALKIFKKDGERFTLLELTPKTGRTHQLRIHLASIGHPIVGDTLYGRRKSPIILSRQFLHASSVEFTSKSGQRIKIEADLPEELRKFLEEL
jgi:23S rRNA pseudouridine1911/1915/1917 synthase